MFSSIILLKGLSKELILEKQGEYNYRVPDMEVLTDHVHILFDVDPRMGIFKVVNKSN